MSLGVRPRKLVLRRLGREGALAVGGGAVGSFVGGAGAAEEGKGKGRGEPKLGTAGATIGFWREEVLLFPRPRESWKSPRFRFRPCGAPCEY